MASVTTMARMCRPWLIRKDREKGRKMAIEEAEGSVALLIDTLPEAGDDLPPPVASVLGYILQTRTEELRKEALGTAVPSDLSYQWPRFPMKFAFPDPMHGSTAQPKEQSTPIPTRPSVFLPIGEKEKINGEEAIVISAVMSRVWQSLTGCNSLNQVVEELDPTDLFPKDKAAKSTSSGTLSRLSKTCDTIKHGFKRLLEVDTNESPKFLHFTSVEVNSGKAIRRLAPYRCGLETFVVPNTASVESAASYSKPFIGPNGRICSASLRAQLKRRQTFSLHSSNDPNNVNLSNRCKFWITEFMTIPDMDLASTLSVPFAFWSELGPQGGLIASPSSSSQRRRFWGIIPYSLDVAFQLATPSRLLRGKIEKRMSDGENSSANLDERDLSALSLTLTQTEPIFWSTSPSTTDDADQLSASLHRLSTFPHDDVELQHLVSQKLPHLRSASARICRVTPRCERENDVPQEPRNRAEVQAFFRRTLSRGYASLNASLVAGQTLAGSSTHFGLVPRLVADVRSSVPILLPQHSKASSNWTSVGIEASISGGLTVPSADKDLLFRHGAKGKIDHLGNAFEAFPGYSRDELYPSSYAFSRQRLGIRWASLVGSHLNVLTRLTNEPSAKAVHASLSTDISVPLSSSLIASAGISVPLDFHGMGKSSSSSLSVGSWESARFGFGLGTQD